MDERLLTRALEIAKKAAQDTGAMLLPHYGNVSTKAESEKGGDSITGALTQLDEDAEKLLQERLRQFGEETGLEVGFIGEQYGGQPTTDVFWLVDPIDGTTHFVRGLPMCTVMIALIENGKVRVAVIHDIANQSTYWAVRDQGTYRDSEKIAVSQRELKKSLVCFESNLDKPENLERFMRLRRQTVPMLGLCSGYEFIMIASGKLDGKVGLDPYGKDWDFAPGSLLVQEAGGVACNVGHKEYDYRNHNFIIASSAVYRDLTSGPEAIFPATLSTPLVL